MGLKSRLVQIVYRFLRLFPVNPGKVLFFSYYGEQYSGSPKYISRYLDQYSDLKIVWAFTDPSKHENYTGGAVKFGHFWYYYHLATAGTIVTNYRMTTDFCKRTNQRYIQTWHSSLRLKMIEQDAEETLPRHYVEMAKTDSTKIDYLLAGSMKSEEIFRRSFWYDGEIIRCGTPQCDILFENRAPYLEKVRKAYGIPDGGRIALYAPTFRKDHDLSVYNIDTNALLQALSKRFGGEWYLLMRLHPHLIGKADCFSYSNKVIQATSYDDAQELLCASDVLLSDYSAIMFDFALTRRPCFLYTPDLKNYAANDRKLYFHIENLPFSNAADMHGLLSDIQNFSAADYQNLLENFLRDIGSFEDGSASRRVCGLIKGDFS